MNQVRSTITPAGKYRKGTRLERKAIALLKREGWEVIRSAGSKGPIDLVAYRFYSILFIQVRANRKPRLVDIQKIQALPIPAMARREIWVFKNGLPEPWIKKV